LSKPGARLCYHSNVAFDRRYRPLCALLGLLAGAVLYYSQVTTLDWDEGFHLVAASLVATGKRPYVDFCFPQPALHAWWNALWLTLAGGGWRGPHAVAALLSCGAILLTTDFVYRRVQAASSVAALLVGLNVLVWEFGTKAQAYGACTFLTVAAFRVTVAGSGILRGMVGGCLAGAAASCSLLAAPACPVLLLWHCWHRRWSDAASFIAGTILATTPILLSLATAPYPTWFNLVEYHVFYRHVGWTGATENDLHVLTSWVDSGQALVLGVFAFAGMWFVYKSDWIAPRKAEFLLAAGMALALAVEAAIAHPTFPQYFIFIVPFLAMPAAIGLWEAASRLSLPPRGSLAALSILLLVSLSNSLIEMRDNNNTWTAMDEIAAKVQQVTPANARVMADPPVYFAMHRMPPPGMEFPASHALELPANKAAALHILTQSELRTKVRSGEFATVETCKGDEEDIEALELPKLYSHSAEISGCQIYWGVAPHVLSYR
jgi:hypothetical protein